MLVQEWVLVLAVMVFFKKFNLFVIYKKKKKIYFWSGRRCCWHWCWIGSWIGSWVGCWIRLFCFVNTHIKNKMKKVFFWFIQLELV